MNSSLAQAWQGEYAVRRLRAQEQTDQQLEPLGRTGLTALAVQPGEWVLDVGCGAGATVLELARAAAPGGGVCGVDVSEQMLERARERCAAQRLQNVQLLAADAASCDFERHFDALYSRFGVMFFDDPAAAFANLRRSVVPGGRLAFVCWQALAQNPWAAQPLAALRAAVPEARLPEMFEPGRPGPFYFGDPERARQPLRAAGWTDIELTPHRMPIHIGGCMSLESAVGYSMEVGPPGRFVVAAGERRADDCRQALTRVLAPFTTQRGTWMEAAVFVITAVSRP